MIIVFEGIDGCGKGTQAKKLHDYLTSTGLKAEIIKFPYYNNQTGEKIRKSLQGIIKISELELAKLHYENKLSQNERIKELVKKGVIVILDRYSLSSVSYQGAKFEGAERTRMIKTIKEWQKNLVKIDLGFFLDLPASISYKRIDERGRKKDVYEEDKKYQELVYNIYSKEAEKEGYIRINCVNEKGGQKTIDEIFSEILMIIKSKTGLIS